MFKLVFLLFVFLYLRFAQYDVVSYLQSYALGHFVVPFPWLSAIIVTLLVAGIVHLGEKLQQRIKYDIFSTYAFCAWGLTSLTSISFVTPLYQIALLITGLVIIFCIVFLKKRIWSTNSTTSWKKTQCFFLQIQTLCLYMGLGNGVTDIQHFELRTAQALMTNHLEEGEKIGDKSYATSQRLFAMRCYLLAKKEDKRELGNHIFEQVVPQRGAASLFFTKDEKQKLLIPSDSLEHLLGAKPFPHESPISYLRRCAWKASLRGKERTPIDYYLCGLLLEKDLDTFAKEVKRFYPYEVASSKLPTFFAQALLLYKRTNTQPQIFYKDSSIEANLQDYMDMGDTITDNSIRCNLLRRSYGSTYWWWYFHGTHI